MSTGITVNQQDISDDSEDDTKEAKLKPIVKTDNAIKPRTSSSKQHKRNTSLPPLTPDHFSKKKDLVVTEAADNISDYSPEKTPMSPDGRRDRQSAKK